MVPKHVLAVDFIASLRSTESLRPLFLQIFLKKGGKRAGKRKHSVEDEGAGSRDGDFLDGDMSEAESCASGFDSDTLEW